MDIQKILHFLSALEQNNHKEWMDAHRSEYEEARDEFKTVVSVVLGQLADTDESLRETEPKDCIFRINRDIRFSKDKTPYKINFGANMAEGGRNSGNAGYYLHLQPDGESFLAGGVYMPPGEHLKLIRQEVDYNGGELKKIVEAEEFKEYFGTLQGEKLSRPPKGYTKDHPNLEFLKLKSYIMLHNLSDEEVTSPDFIPKALTIFRAMKPLNDYLNVAISATE